MEPQDLKARSQVSISPASDKPRSESEVRVAAWSDFDAGGFRLRQTLAARLRRIEVRFLTALGVTEALVLVLIVRLEEARGGAAFQLAFWCLGGLFIFAYLAYKRRFLKRTFGEEAPENPVFVAIFEVDGVEYGRDIGSLVLEDNWVYFEGERTTFTLGVGHFYVEWSDLWFRSSKRATLFPRAANRHVSIHLDLEASKYVDFEEVFRYWQENSRSVRGIAVLPPLTPSKENQACRPRRALWSAAVTFLAACLAFICLLLALSAHMAMLANISLFLLLALLACVGIDLAHASNHEKRIRAFERLEKIRARIEGQKS